MAVEEPVFTVSSHSITSITSTAVEISLSGSWAERQINGNLGAGVLMVNLQDGSDIINGSVSYAAMSGNTTATVTASGLTSGATYAIPECAGNIFYDNARLNIPTRIEFTTVSPIPVEDESYLNKRGLTHFWENIDDIKQDKLTAGDNISITSNTISADTGWVYLGEQSLSADGGTLTYTLPAQYDNYKVVFYGTMASTASDGGWVDFIMLNGSTAINVVHQVQLVEGTTWSSAWNSGTFAMNGQINPYAGVTITFESFRAGSADWRVYKGSFCSNAGGSATARSTIVNGRATSGTQPTAFQVKSYSGNFIAGTSMRIWASDNGH